MHVDAPRIPRADVVNTEILAIEISEHVGERRALPPRSAAVARSIDVRLESNPDALFVRRAAPKRTHQRITAGAENARRFAHLSRHPQRLAPRFSAIEGDVRNDRARRRGRVTVESHHATREKMI